MKILIIKEHTMNLTINKENGIIYLTQILPRIGGIGSDCKIISFEEITEETYVNYIFRAEITTAAKKLTFYLRQTRDHVKTRPDLKIVSPSSTAP